jgi:hypothetical protein
VCHPLRDRQGSCANMRYMMSDSTYMKKWSGEEETCPEQSFA